MAIAFENIPKEFVIRMAPFDYKTPVTEILGKLNSRGAVVLTKGKEYYGMIDSRSMARKGGTRVEKLSSAGKYAVKVPVLDKETSIAKAIGHFYGSGARALPYSESGKVIGIVKRSSMLKAILSLHMLAGYKAKELMSTPVMAIESDRSVAEASSTMRQRRINRLVVTSSGRLFGIVSHKDMLNYSAKLKQRGSSKLEGSLPSMQGQVADIAERNVHSVGYNDTVESAIRDMVESNISSLLVVRGGNPVGILTARDMLSAAHANDNAASEGIMLSGMDSGMGQYEDALRSEAEKFIAKVDKFTKFKVENIAIHVRKHKVRNYEVQVRAWLQRSGAVSVSSQGYSMEFTTKDALDRAYGMIKDKKEIVYTGRKTADSQYTRDEE